MAVRHLNTEGLQNTTKDFQNSIQTFRNCVDDVEKTKNALLDSWSGKGRDQFETQYSLMYRKLGDLYDTLYDIYNALIDAEAAYVDADEAVAKELETAVSQ